MNYTNSVSVISWQAHLLRLTAAKKRTQRIGTVGCEAVLIPVKSNFVRGILNDSGVLPKV